jgi:hypothetical protein
MDASVLDNVLDLCGSLMRMRMRSFRVVAIPFGIPGLITPEPLEKPFYRSFHFVVNRNGRSPPQILLNGHLSQAFFVHRFPSYVVWAVCIIPQISFQGNRCIGIKTDIKGNLCSGTTG